MTPERFAQVERIFDQARGLSPSQRSALLDSLCGDDHALRGDVEALLKHDVPTPKPMVQRLTDVVVDDDEPAKAPARFLPEGASTDLTGQCVGPYSIVRVIGRGGMGVVYLARDPRLQRDVAIKTLPAELVGHTARADRFLREAQLLASLSHPNIATVYGLEECDAATGGGKCLVLELVEGESLAHRLARGPLSIEQSLDVCREISAGVEAAHLAGVIHRDLKPPNVMIGEDGIVKVLDFGLARSIDPPAGSPVETKLGAAVGTPGYMSPEQLRGEVVDKRTDVFAIGCILYECLTGEVAFAGESGAEAAASVLHREPDWERLPPRTPANVRRLLARCLAKDRGRRLRDVGDVRLELEDALEAREWAASSVTLAAVRSRHKKPNQAILLVATLFAVAAIVYAVAQFKQRPSKQAAPPPSAPVQQFAIAFPKDALQSNLSHVRLALSRDGGRLIISATDGEREALYVRERDRGLFRRIDGTDNAWMPSLSPDGQWVVYFDHGVVRKRPIAGGNPVRISDVHGYFAPYSWSPDGFISYVPYWSGGIARIPADGGKFEFITQPDNKQGEFAHLAPFTLADGSAVLYTVWDGSVGTRVDSIDLKTHAKKNVIADGNSQRVAQTPYGPYLLWARAGTIYAAPFDPATVTRGGREVAIADSVLNDRVLFAAAFDVSDDGTFAYVPGPTFVEESRLSWVDPKLPNPRVATPMNEDRLGLVEPNFSKDGQFLSVILKADVFKPYLYDLKAQTFNRVVVDGDCESRALSPDGKRLAYCSNREGAYHLWLRDLAAHTEQKLFQGPGDYPCTITWSPDGKSVAFATTPDQHSNRDVYVVNLSDMKPLVFCDAKGEQRAPRWSPDGKWLAYSSDETGTREIFLRSYPDGKQTRQVTLEGGDWPVWDPAGGRLYFRTPGEIYAALIADDGTVTGKPELIYDKPFGQSDFDLPDYTAAPDGRLLIVEPSERGPKVSQIHVILNWYNLPEVRAGK
jgi:serine/threonine protein kinase/WD40 repeat protein